MSKLIASKKQHKLSEKNKMEKINREKIKTWFVTGASSGFGKEICTQLLQRGYNVIAVARRIPDFIHENVLCLSVDVTDADSVAAAVKKGIEKFGKIDVLSNNAGVSASITAEEESLEHMKEVMNTNFFGTFNTVNKLLPHFRKNKNGTIINNTSQSGVSPRLYGSAYCSSKYAIEGFTSVLKMETHAFCRVMAFELSFFPGTEIGKTRKTIVTEIEEYKQGNTLPPPTLCLHENNFENTVAIIIDTVENKKLPRHLLLGKEAPIRARIEVDVMQESIKYSLKHAKKSYKDLYKIGFKKRLFSKQKEFYGDKIYRIFYILGFKIKIRKK